MQQNAKRLAYPPYGSPHVFQKLAERLKRASGRMTYRLSGYLLTHPKTLRWVFARFRRWRPVVLVGRFVLLTKHDDILSVLNRNEDFELGEFASERMLSGDFLLQVDWPRGHMAQEAALERCLAKGLAERIKQVAAQACQDAINANSGQIDVAEVARTAAMDIVHRCYGVPVTPSTRQEVAEDLTVLASAIILLPPQGSPERVIAEKAADRLNHLIRQHVTSTERQSVPKGDTLLAHLLVARKRKTAPNWLDDDWIVRMTCGMSVFGMATLVRTACDILDELLRQPAPVLRNAQQAAQEAEDRPQELLGYIYEALRFRPMLPVLARYAPRPLDVGTYHGRRRNIPAGATVMVPPLAAMHDPGVFDAPHSFRPERMPQMSFVFGRGQHQCLGQNLAETALIEIVGAVLRQPALRRLPGKTGRVRYKGAAAEQLLVGL